MSRLLLPVCFTTCLALVFAIPGAPVVAAPPAKVDEELVEKVHKAIFRAVEYLKNKQNPQGTWEGIVLQFLAGMEGGQTALVTLALLNSGLVKPDDAILVKPLRYLKDLPPSKTYVVALTNLVFAETRDKKYSQKIQANADWLIEHATGWNKEKGTLDGWSYPQNQIADNSNTQYALLGLYAAKQAGAQIDQKVWEAILDYYTRTQRTKGPKSGYWTYYNERDNMPSISMTVAGVCGLLIAGMGLDKSEQELDPQTGVAKNCGVYNENAAVAKGMSWVADNFTFSSPKSTSYNIYGIERLGRLSGQRFIGTHDWYREGCEKLVDLQDANGSILAGGKSIDGHALISTSFALLFLSKGRTPVLISKFAWGELTDSGNGFVEVSPPGAQAPPGNANWNRKHNDTRHMVEFCSKELFDNMPLSWQVYDARRRDFSDGGGKSGKEKILEEVGLLLQSPVLYVTGHGPFRLTAAQEEILKTYVEEGGFLVGEACCGDPVFAKSFKAVMGRLFPDNKFEPIPAEHIILKILPGLRPTDFPDLQILNRGCRTVAVFSPTPLAGYWEEAKYMPKDSVRPQNKGEKVFCLIRNIVAYATGLEPPKPKLSTTSCPRRRSK
jgi:hypothetical protein